MGRAIRGRHRRRKGSFVLPQQERTRHCAAEVEAGEVRCGQRQDGNGDWSRRIDEPKFTTDGRLFLACIAYLLRFSDLAEGVFWRRFMNWGLIMGLQTWYNQR